MTEIACHLRDVETEVHSVRYKVMLEENDPFVSGVDSDVWAEARNYQEQDGPAALAAFTAERWANVERLRALSPADWLRPVRHAIIGPSTFAEIVRIAIEHDRLHVRQIADTLAARRSQSISL